MEHQENNIDEEKQEMEYEKFIDGKDEKKADDVTDDDIDMMCGIGSWRPKFLQVFANIKFVFFLFCTANFLFTFSFSVFISTLTSIQKRYGLPSFFFGLNATLFDSATLICVLFVAYLGGRPGSHRPRWIGVGLILGALSLSSISISHFMSSPYEYSRVDIESNQTSMCSGNRNDVGYNVSDVDCSSASARAAETDSVRMAAMMLIGHSLAGIFYTPLVVLTPTYMDDFIGKKKSPLYLGIFYAMYSLGPVVGFPFSSIFVSLYVDVGRVDMSTIDITQGDARWVGAWWLGFIAEGCFTLLVAIPLIFAPKKLPLSEDKVKDMIRERNDQMSKNDEDDDETAIGQEAIKRIKEFPRALCRLFTNVSLITISIAYAFEVAIISGLVTYATKYTEVQFRISPSLAANVTGVGLVISSTIGTLLGGYLLRRFKPDLVTTAKYVAIIGVINIFLPIPSLFLGCDSEIFSGVTVPYKGVNIVDVAINGTYDIQHFTYDSQLSAACNIDCGCVNNGYDPVCGNDGVSYYSPCFAGCTEASTDKNFSSCACIDAEVLSDQTAVGGGICGGQCITMLIAFTVVIFVESLIASLPLTAFVIITFRCVSPADKPFALGVRQLFAQIIGWVPTPLYMGVIIDSTCLLWSQAECSTFSTCWQYDLFDYRSKLITFQLVFKILALVMYLICWWSLKRGEKKGNNILERKDVNLNLNLNTDKEEVDDL